ncbi:hypothetical protein [Paraburkholderia sp.]|uniref:hypothetical protein n=1 Tax=Paraburkholderia sp. TaxID=1926495 RepID=UPI00286EEC18|nr:hypothetical protein [Paraburkholderia sp.]
MKVFAGTTNGNAAEARSRGAQCVGCARCVHWADDRALLEARIAGLASFGSAYGASVGESRLCLRHDRLTQPADRCAVFVERVAAFADRS